MITFDGRDLHVDPKLAALLHGRDGIKRAGPAAILTMPGAFRGPASSKTFVLRQLSTEPERKYPIDVLRVLGAGTSVT